MAVAVPLLLANTAAGAAIAGAVGLSTTALAVATSVAFQVTGVNDKINKAASNVFGEDLVKVANIAGAVYGAWNGGFSLDPAKEFLGIGEVAASGADAAFNADWTAATGGGAMAGEEVLASGMDSFNLSDAASAGASAADKSFEQDWSDSLAGRQTASESGTDLLTQKPSGLDARVSASNETPTSEPAKPTTAGVEQKATTPVATSASATASNAAGTQATAAQSSVDKLLGINRSTPSATAANATAPQSVFDKVFSKVGDKTIAGLIQGAAGGYSNSQRAKLAAEQARVNPTTIRGYTYRPTV